MDYSYFKKNEHYNNDEYKPFLVNNPKFKWLMKIALPILLIYILFLLYSGNMDFWIYDKVLIWIPFLIILIIIPLILFFSLAVWINSENKKNYLFIFSALSVIIHGPFFGFWIGEHEIEIYRKYGVKTTAVVTQSFYSKGERMYYEFKAKDMTYESFNVTNKGKHIIGDSIEIIYNKNNPEMNEAVEQLED